MSALKKTTLEEWGEVYVGVRASPAPLHISVLFSRLTFFQWGLEYDLNREGQQALERSALHIREMIGALKL